MKEALAAYKEKFPVLETERVILRRILPSDRIALFSILSDGDVMRYYNIFPLSEIEEADAIIDKLNKHFESGLGIRWAIVLKSDLQFIGSIGIFDKNDNPFNAEIGFEISKKYWGQGLVKEAISPALAFGFNSLGLERIEARVVNGNATSQRVLEKCSFEYEGLQRKKGYWKNELHDLHFYSILKTDFHS